MTDQLLRRDPLESARFGIEAARLLDPTAAPADVDEAARAVGADFLSVRVPSGASGTVQRLEAGGFRLMDTLVYYARRSGGPHEAPRCAIRFATPQDSAVVGSIAARAFQDYMGHYHADPRLDGAAADAVYVDWAERSTRAASSDKPVLLAMNDDGAIGFLTLRRNSEAEMEIVLNAVHPAHQGAGIYADLVRAAIDLTDRCGCERLLVSTPIQNYPVQRVWVRHGFVPSAGVHTLHKWYDDKTGDAERGAGPVRQAGR